MKFRELLRSPVYLIILFVFAFSGLFLLTFINNMIMEYSAALDEMYQSIRIRCSLISRVRLETDNDIPLTLAGKIRQHPAVKDLYFETNAPALIYQPAENGAEFLDYQNITGVSSFERFTELYNAAADNKDDLRGNTCILEEQYMKDNGLTVGNHLLIAVDTGEEIIEKIDNDEEYCDLEIIGSYHSDSELPLSLIITSADLFYAHNGILRTDEAKAEYRNCRNLEFWIDSSYNNRFNEVKEELKRLIGNEWELYSTSRELDLAVQPMSERILIMRNVLKLLNIFVMIMMAVISFLQVNNMRSNFLIMKMCGEYERKIFADICTKTLSAEMILIFAALILANCFSKVSSMYVLSVGMIVSVTTIITAYIYTKLSISELMKMWRKSDE